MATTIDCYNFARETGIITTDELFLGANGDETGGQEGAGGSPESGRASGKKRKASSSGDGRVGPGVSTSNAPPRVLRSLAGVVDRFGAFLEGFPFQSLVGTGSNPRGGDNDGRGKFGGTGLVGKDEGRPVSGRAESSSRSVSHRSASSRPLITDDPGLLPTDRASARLSRAVLLRRGFTFLAGCLSDTTLKDAMAALLVEHGLWSRSMHLVVVYSLVWPWAGGLLPRPSDGDEVEQCETR